MKSSISMALGALIACVMAQPMVEKRDVTVIDWVTVTVDVWTTITGDAPPASSTTAGSNHHNHLAYHAQKAAVPAAPPVSSPSPAAQQQQHSPPQNNPAPVQQNAAVNPAPAPATGSSPEEIQAAEDAKQEAINQKQIDTNNAQKSADFAHQDQMNALQNGGGGGGGQASPPVQQQQQKQQQQAPPPSPTPAAPAAQSPAPAAPAVAGNGGSCGSIGGSCSGDVTIYNDQGLGACGWNNDTNSEDFFALAAPMFGTYTNDSPGPHKNPFCGRMASIQVNGQSFTGMLTDRCGGCVGQSIDLSQHLFSQLYPNEPPGNGRYHDVSWHFMSEPEFSQG